MLFNKWDKLTFKIIKDILGLPEDMIQSNLKELEHSQLVVKNRVRKQSNENVCCDEN